MVENHPVLLTDTEQAVLSRWRARALRRHLFFLGVSLFFLLGSGVIHTNATSRPFLWSDPAATAQWISELSTSFSIYSVYPLAVILSWAWSDAKFRRDLAEGLVHCKGTVSQIYTRKRRWKGRSNVHVVYLTPSDPDTPKPIVLRAALTDGMRLPRFTTADCAYFPNTNILYRADEIVCDQHPSIWRERR